MIADFEETIVGPATIPGTGAVTLIRVSGKDCFPIIDRVVRFRNGDASSAAAQTIKYGCIYNDDGSFLDEVLVAIFRSPCSYTGEDSVEISCHASSFIASEVMRLLCEAGARPAEPGEFTRRSFVNGKMDLAQAEAVADVISSTNSASLKVAANQLRGGYSKELMNMRTQLLEISALLELELDFSEEDVEFADRDKLSALLDETISHLRSLADSFRHGNALRNGVPVAIVGAVNSGKSTLLNALIGDDRAIVSDKAGTTRDTIEETMVIDGTLFRFIDTAGFRETSDEIEMIGMERSFKKLSEASVVLLLVDRTAIGDQLDPTVHDILSRLDLQDQKAAILLNKSDLLPDNKFVCNDNKFVSFAGDQVLNLNISAKEGFGLSDLKSWLADTQKHLSVDSGQTIVTNLRHHTALVKASESLLSVKSSLSSGLPSDLLAEDLRQANHHLGVIFGECTPDEVLTEIFSRFCIGK